MELLYHVVNAEDEMVVCGHCMMSMAEFGGDWIIIDSGRDSEFDKTIERCEHIKRVSSTRGRGTDTQQ